MLIIQFGTIPWIQKMLQTSIFFIYGNGWLSIFFINQKNDFLKFCFSKNLGCVRDRTQVTKTMVYSKVESAKD